MKRIIVTISQSLLKQMQIKDIDAGNHIYRINGAQVTIKEARQMVQAVRKDLPRAPIMVDLPGNKIRTANLKEPIKLERGKCFKLAKHEVNYDGVADYLRNGDIVLAGDSTLKFIVHSVNSNEIEFLSQSDGELRNNKGLHVRGICQKLPFFFDKDREVIKLANECSIDFIGLSYIRDASDIVLAREAVNPGITLIAKVETLPAVQNLEGILGMVDYILIDRGDLSAEVGLEKVPLYQKHVIEKAVCRNIKVFLSTQFLKNMEERPVPSIAEVIDLYNTLKMGIYGIQLSDETAVGKYPRETLDVVRRVMAQIESEALNCDAAWLGN